MSAQVRVPRCQCALSDSVERDTETPSPCSAFRRLLLAAVGTAGMNFVMCNAIKCPSSRAYNTLYIRWHRKPLHQYKNDFFF